MGKHGASPVPANDQGVLPSAAVPRLRFATHEVLRILKAFDPEFPFWTPGKSEYIPTPRHVNAHIFFSLPPASAWLRMARPCPLPAPRARKNRAARLHPPLLQARERPVADAQRPRQPRHLHRPAVRGHDEAHPQEEFPKVGLHFRDYPPSLSTPVLLVFLRLGGESCSALLPLLELRNTIIAPMKAEDL
jgi:hypothetical protein